MTAIFTPAELRGRYMRQRRQNRKVVWVSGRGVASAVFFPRYDSGKLPFCGPIERVFGPVGLLLPVQNGDFHEGGGLLQNGPIRGFQIEVLAVTDTLEVLKLAPTDLCLKTGPSLGSCPKLELHGRSTQFVPGSHGQVQRFHGRGREP